jgi:hypothetical protein
MIRDAVRRRSPFNLIHLETMFKMSVAFYRTHLAGTIVPKPI